MDSDDSDNEPLSKIISNRFEIQDYSNNALNRRRVIKLSEKRFSTKFKHKIKTGTEVIDCNLVKVKSEQVDCDGSDSRLNLFDKPIDVWLYMKDLNSTGPYSCLLCSEWFINRSKLIIHYILNHKKEYCGICRYFVEDRDAWILHWSCHIPLQCSHCHDTFSSELDLRTHFSDIHGFVHCRLCYFMMPDNIEYDNHLLKKHYVTLATNKNAEIFWNADDEISTKFICLLCEKDDLQKSEFFRHYMCYHRFTLKCLTSIITGRDVPFSVFGANIDTSNFGEEHTVLSNNFKVNLGVAKLENDSNISNDLNLMQALIPEIKQETFSDNEEIDQSMLNNSSGIIKTGSEIAAQNAEKTVDETLKNYEGQEDFDVTLLELIMLRQSDVEYIESILDDLNTQKIPVSFSVKKSQVLSDAELLCQLCHSNDRSSVYKDLSIHSAKMHGFKYVSQNVCRLCFAMFDSESGLTSHLLNEIEEFKNLYLCQFCDKSFVDREEARSHLSNHWDNLTLSNCTSPQLGFKCKYCSQLFWNEYDREFHHCASHYVSNKDSFYKCTDCQKLFSDKIWYIHHQWSHHHNKCFRPNSYVIKCLLCCTVYVDIPGVREHFQFWHPEAKKIYCNLGECSMKPFTTVRSLKLHVKNVHIGTSNNFHGASAGGLQGSNACSICGREFNSARAASSHMALAHGAGRFKCKICEATLHTSDERKLHYLLKHPGNAPYECSFCGKRFQNKSSLYMHRSHQHSLNFQTHTCSYCGKTFTKKDSYREHVSIHTGPLHVCSYCPRRFVQRSNMLRHERRHTGERPYTCEHCGRAFADKGACNSHMRTHTRDQVYGCTYCGQTFSQKPKLKYHIRKHTGENLETCPVCSKLFTSVCALREHMRIHDESEKTPCPDCGKLFTSTRYMIRHMRSTHGDQEDEQECPICNKTFTTIIKLRSHVLTHCNMKTLECTFCRKRYSGRKSMMRHLQSRHRMSGTNDILKTGYAQLDPRDCNLNLDEKTICRIFGASRRPRVPVESKDYVLYPKNLPSIVAERINKIDEDGIEVTNVPVVEQMEADSEVIHRYSVTDSGTRKGEGIFKINIKLTKSNYDEEMDICKREKRLKKAKRRKKKKEKYKEIKVEFEDFDAPQCSEETSPFSFISIKKEPEDEV